MEQYMPYLWIGLAVVLAIVELSTSQLVSVWMVIGAVITAICSATFLTDSIIWQIVIFVFVSALCLILTRPLVKRLKKVETAKTNSDRYIGKTAKVLSEINSTENTGIVEVEGSRWSAKSVDGSVVEVGRLVKVESIQGVKLIVASTDK